MYHDKSSVFFSFFSCSPLLFSTQLSSFSGAEKSSVPREHRHLVALAALLPQRVIKNLVEQRRIGKPGKPRYATECMDAALLFVDISGYTSSMEMFAQQGAQGIEKFWKMFNAYFCDLLDIIQVVLPLSSQSILVLTCARGCFSVHGISLLWTMIARLRHESLLWDCSILTYTAIR